VTLMDPSVAARLGDQAALDQRAVVASLAAAERAEFEGRPHVARVLRAVAGASEARAYSLERLAAGQAPSLERLHAEREHQHRAAAMLAEIILTAENVDERELAVELSRLLTATRSAARVLDAAATSLIEHDDVVDRFVPDQLWVCTECGLIAEHASLEACTSCGAAASAFDCYQ